MNNNVNIRNITHLGLLFAMSIVLMVVEWSIPPIVGLPPGIKLGLSNIIVMYCLFYLPKKNVFVILILKSLFIFITRGPISSLMSFSGGLASILIVILVLSLKKLSLSFIMVSILGAIFHNIGQLLIATFLIGSDLVILYSPILILSGVFMGILTGNIISFVLPAIRRLK